MNDWNIQFERSKLGEKWRTKIEDEEEEERQG